MQDTRCRCTKVGGTLVPRTCARAVVAPRGKACQAIAKTLNGSLLGHSRTKYLSQGPGKRSLPGRPPDERNAPARGACREGPPKRAVPRQEQFAGTAARSIRPRQEELAGKAIHGTTRTLP